jgi:hypothetical protein
MVFKMHKLICRRIGRTIAHLPLALNLHMVIVCERAIIVELSAMVGDALAGQFRAMV